MGKRISCGNFNEANIKAVRRHYKKELKEAKKREKLGLPDEPVCCMINAGPPPCKVTITDESQKICAKLICKV